MSDIPFTLDQLRILKAISTEGSFKRAADSLYVVSTCCQSSSTKFGKAA